MKAQIIPPPLEAKIIDFLVKFDCDNFNKQFVADLYLKTNLTKAQIQKSNLKGFISSKLLDLKILDTVTIDAGGDDVASVIFSFTQADLTDGKLRRTHNFNQQVIDASVFDDVGKEVMVGLEIVNTNTIELDFSRVQINGVWKLLVEK